MPKRALVTGGAGFIGSHLCERLLDEDYEVVCVDNLLTGSRDNVSHLHKRGRFSFLHGDVSGPVHLERPVDLILHFASPASPFAYGRYPIETLRVGALGTLNTLEMARDMRARFVLASTSEVYGDPLEHPQPETYWGNVNPVGPRSVYDEAKRFAEALTATFRREHGVRASIVRIFNTFGPRMAPDDGRVVPTFVTQALRGEPLPITRDGGQTRSICYVDDIVDGVLRMAQTDIMGPVNLGNDEELSVLDLAVRIKRLIGSDSRFTFTRRPVDDPEKRRPDLRLARRVLGWSPSTPIDEGLRRTIAWFEEILAEEQEPQAAS